MTIEFASHEVIAFDLYAPADQRVPWVLNSPHSGCLYPAEFLRQTALGHQAVRKSEDFFVDELFSACVDLGLPLLAARYPRAFLDLNREPYELDPTMFAGRLPEFVRTSTSRVASGLGTIARIVAEGQEIYREKLSVEEAFLRIERYYLPYHEALHNLLIETRSRFGYAVLVDCHSMPASSVAALPAKSIDMVLGDRYGSSCSPGITNWAKRFLEEMGYRVTLNRPFAGGFITEHYGRPQNGIHAIQIEINRSLYMDELHQIKNSGFYALAKDLHNFISRLVSIPESDISQHRPLAAE